MRNRQAFLMLLGAGAGTKVPVRVGARVVAILVAEAHVAAVVVVAAAPGETLNHRKTGQAQIAARSLRFIRFSY